MVESSAEGASALWPQEVIRQVEGSGEGAMQVKWQDGHESRYPWHYLKNMCICALCQPNVLKYITRVLIPIALNVHIEHLEQVGHYALGINWQDGHHSILPWEYLRHICPCETCKPKVLEYLVGERGMTVEGD